LRGWTRNKIEGPAFHRGSLRIAAPADTWLDMSAFGKGFAWVNGRNLGRHWKLGPQRALYFPAPWQRKGDNPIVVFDLDGVDAASIRGVKEPIWRTAD